jgi:hypothetical protein
MMATALESATTHGPAPEGSDRSFGFVFAVVFALIACWPLLSWRPPYPWLLGVAIAFALVAAIRPSLLRPLNKAWLAFGRLLSRIVNPLIMGLVFFLGVTPTGWIMRLRGRDLLARTRRPDMPSYWVARDQPAPEPDSMRRQF